MPSDLPNLNDHTRVPKLPSDLVQGWIPYLDRSLEQRRLKRYANADTKVRTSALISLIGSAGDGEATLVFQSFVYLFFHHDRVSQWQGAVERIPANREKILRVTRAVQACNLLLEPVERASFPLYNFINISLKVLDPKGFIEASKQSGSFERKIHNVFLEKNFAFVADRFRGLVGDAADPSYRDTLRRRIRTVSG